MKDCPTNQEIQAYHDGELDAARREAVKRHLAACPPCSLLVSQLVAMSKMFAGAPVPILSQIAMHRLHRKVEAAMERGLLRIAWAISGIAASILVGGSLLLSTMNTMKQAAPAEYIGTNTVESPPWVGVTASADAALTPDAATPVAEWYLANPSNNRSSDDSQ